MRRWILRIIAGLVILSLALCALIWAALATPLFSGWRKDFVSDLLTEQIGQSFLIDGDVRVVLGSSTKVHVSGASIPSENITSLNLAELDLLEWELDLPALFERRIDIDNLTIDGLQTNLITQADGTTSWNKPDTTAQSPASDTSTTQSPKSSPKHRKPSIISFLSDRTVSFTNIGLVSMDEESGFEFILTWKKSCLSNCKTVNWYQSPAQAP